MKWIVLSISSTAVIFTAIFILILNQSDKPDSPNPDAHTLNSNALPLSDWVGKKAPPFSLKSYDGETYSLEDFIGKKVILFFNEGIMCYPACWNQMAALGEDLRLNTEQIKTISIVPDQAQEWIEATGQVPKLKSELILLDSTKTVSSTYNMLNQPSSMHRGSMPGHSYLILDENGVIRFTYDDPKMAIRNDLLFSEIEKLK